LTAGRGGRASRVEVIHTADPVAALRLATDEHWDLLVTDLDMPGMSGLELLGALRQVAPALPVAVVSAPIGRGRQRWAGPYPDTPGHDTLPT